MKTQPSGLSRFACFSSGPCCLRQTHTRRHIDKRRRARRHWRRHLRSITRPRRRSDINGICAAYTMAQFSLRWGPTFGLDWHSTDFDQTLGGLNAASDRSACEHCWPASVIRRQAGRWSVFGQWSGGYSFNSFTVANDARPTFASRRSPARRQRRRQQLGGEALTSRRFRFDGLQSTVERRGSEQPRTSIARPKTRTITTATGTARSMIWKADAFELGRCA
jgi:hypothetical protein